MELDSSEMYCQSLNTLSMIHIFTKCLFAFAKYIEWLSKSTGIKFNSMQLVKVPALEIKLRIKKLIHFAK